MQQNAEYWDTEDSISRYVRINYRLTDAEITLIGQALQELGKPISEINLLDLGCGGGRTTVPLHKLGLKVLGLDIAKNLIEELQRNFPNITAQVGDAASLPFDQNEFDIVLFSHNSLDYLYPIEKRLSSIKEIYRVLKPSGYFVFSSHIFNVIPNSMTAIKNILQNIKIFPEIIFRGGYYEEKMKNGMSVTTYAGPMKSVISQLSSNKFHFCRSIRVIQNEDSLFLTLLRAYANWERYYLFKKAAAEESQKK